MTERQPEALRIELRTNPSNLGTVPRHTHNGANESLFTPYLVCGREIRYMIFAESWEIAL